MSKFIPDTTIDALLDEIATCTRMDVTSDTTTPTNLTNTLANVTLTAGDGNGDYTIANGDASGRKITISEQTGVSITATGSAQHIVLSLAGVIKAITTCTAQTLTTGGTVTFPSWKHEVADPS